MEQLDLYTESLIFASEVPISIEEMKNCIESAFKVSFSSEQIERIVERLQKKYISDQFSFEIVLIGKGYQFLTKSKYHDLVAIHLKQKSNKKLSKSAMETLAVIAYQQPVTKGEVEQVRGVNCDYAIQKLLEKELIQIKGRSKEPGRPLLYNTSEKFMEHFGLSALQDLPKLKEFNTEDNQIGNFENKIDNLIDNG